jgi:hypothetical protein
MTPRFAAALLAALACPIAAAPAATDPTLLAGLSGVAIVDTGTFVVTDAGPFDRHETFEVLRRRDGGYTLVNSITATNGAYRVQGRFDFDGAWNAQNAVGIGLYKERPVAIAMRRSGKRVDITVTPVDGTDPAPQRLTSACDPSCFIDMSPAILPMFVMTRHYDLAKGGEQRFLWAGQDLDQGRTADGNVVQLRFAGQRAVRRAGGAELQVRHFTFVESIPLPQGGAFKMNFDLWTDLEHAPLAFRAQSPGGRPGGIFGIRRGHEDLRDALRG